MTKTKPHKKVTGVKTTPVEVPEVSFLHHWEKFRAIFGATGVVFDTCRPLFYMPQVSFLHHTYLSHPQNLFLKALKGGYYTRDPKTRRKIGPPIRHTTSPQTKHCLFRQPCAYIQTFKK